VTDRSFVASPMSRLPAAVSAIPLAWFRRLLHASAKQRQHYEISGGGAGLHREELDEDIAVAGLLVGQGDLTKPVPAVA
jgi:hypothetical protein